MSGEHESRLQAMQTPAGLERVKGLIRSDEAGEEDGGATGAPWDVQRLFAETIDVTL
jgi:hypothetical protein